MRIFAFLLAAVFTFSTNAGAAPVRPMLMDPVTITADQAAPAASGGHLIPKITFDVEVTGEAVDTTIGLLEQAQAAKAEAVVIEFDTPGGEVDAGFRLAKAIEASTVPVICVVDGEADSMGFYLLQSCQQRIMTDRSVLMAHEAATGGNFYGKPEAWHGMYERLRVKSDAMAHHECRRMKISYQEFLAKTHDHDWYMGSEEASAVGAVDQVITTVGQYLTGLRTNGLQSPT